MNEEPVHTVGREVVDLPDDLLVGQSIIPEPERNERVLLRRVAQDGAPRLVGEGLARGLRALCLALGSGRPKAGKHGDGEDNCQPGRA